MEVNELVCPARAAPPAAKGKVTKNEPKDEGVQFKDSLKEKITEENIPEEKKLAVQDEQSSLSEEACASAALAALMKAPEMPEMITVDAGEVEEVSQSVMAADMLTQTASADTTETAQEAAPAPVATMETAVEDGSAEAELAMVVQSGANASKEFVEIAGEQSETVKEVSQGEVTVQSGNETGETTPVLQQETKQTTVMEQEVNFAQTSTVAAQADTAMKPVDAGQTIQTLPEKTVSQITNTVREMVENGQKVFNLSLHPEEMGRVNVRLSTGPDGLRVIVSADRSSTGEILEKSISQLQEKLSSAGVQIGEMSVGYFQKDAQNPDQEWKPDSFHPVRASQTNATEENPKQNNQWVSSRRVTETALDFMA